jgi:hypothetical protein
VAKLVEALRYKPEGLGFDSQSYHWNFSWHKISRRIVTLRLTQPLSETSIRNISWGVKALVRRADNLTTFKCRLSWNLGDSTSWNPQGLSRPVMGLLYLLEVWVTRNNFHTKYPQKSAANLEIVVVTTNWRVAICAPRLIIFLQKKKKRRKFDISFV